MNWKILFPLYLGATIGPMGGIGIVTLLPVLADLWSVPFGTASLAIPLYMIPFIVVQTFSGSIAQLFDTRRTLLLGFTVYAVGGTLCGLSPTFWTFLGSRVVQGVGAAFVAPIVMALIGELVPEKHVGKAMGILGLAYTVGVTLGPLFSGFVEVRAGWPFFFYFLAGLAAVSGLLYAGTSTRAAKQKAPGKGLFDLIPLMRSAAAQPGVLTLSFSAFSLFLAYIGIMTFTAGHLRSTFGLPSDRIGALISSTGISGIGISPVAGYLGDRFGKTRVFVAGMFVCFCCISLMTMIPYSYGAYFWLFLLFGAGSATAWTTLNTAAVQLAPSMRKPVTSVYNALKFSGYALSPVILSLLYGPFGLAGVQWGCLAAIGASSVLAILANAKERGRAAALASGPGASA